MQTNEITVTNKELGMPEALDETERLGYETGLTHKENLRLRLLAEELLGMIRGITEDAAATYWVEEMRGSYFLYLASDVNLTRQMREQILAVSTSGKNEAVKGFMGKIREMIGVMLLPDRSPQAIASGMAMGIIGLDPESTPQAQQASLSVLSWSMQKYKIGVSDLPEDAPEADELEKSIVASLADEVKVTIQDMHVEVVIEKTFSMD